MRWHIIWCTKCWFIESGDDNIDNESDRDFDPEIARKIERSLLCFSSNAESMRAKNKTELIEITFMQLEDYDMAKTRHYPTLKNIFEEIQG